MEMNSKIRWYGSYLAAICLLIGKASAESAKYELGSMMAQYIESQDLIIQLRSTKCGYLIKIKVKNYEELKREIYASIYPKLNDKERTELSNIYDAQFQRLHHANKIALEKNLKLFSDNGMDDKSACGLLVGNVSPQFQKALNDWERVTR